MSTVVREGQRLAAVQLPSACNVCSYRSRDEIKGVRKERDPIMLFKRTILDNGLATEEEIKVRIPSCGCHTCECNI